jgi:hypothetical protein
MSVLQKNSVLLYVLLWKGNMPHINTENQYNLKLYFSIPSTLGYFVRAVSND